ncbi:hypothetical protein BVG19_g5682 [[Candida] boidinii]|nr:hypothetical protein BVG19_g5682 [[Candida] boidinii]OWB54098.1 hypothetical protein B5S27_g5728 [[Candida] boidinii]OWB84374.1 hypothetical protein B5S33_g3019 [[Candida] boidinii]
MSNSKQKTKQIPSANIKRTRSATSSQTKVENENENTDDGIESPPPSKRFKKDTKLTKEQENFLLKEKEYDDLLPEEYRKYRPKGFKLNTPPTDRPIRIYADGVFDLFHLGHMRQLEQCKKSFPNVTLVCGIPNDIETHKRKGLTVLTDQQRYETLRHCKWVDEVIEDAPWILSMDFLEKHKIDYCAHDDLPYVADGIDDIYKPMKQAGKFLVTQRTEGISTSDIITKIIRDYDKYLMRNFARGATRKELNVSWLKKNELDFKKQINEFRSYWKKANVNLNNTSKDLYFEIREFLRSKINNNNNHNNNNRLSRLTRKQIKDIDTISVTKDNNSDSNDSMTESRSNSNKNSPAFLFASKYNGNEGLRRSRSLIDSFKDWINGDDHSEIDESSNQKSSEDYDEEDEDDVEDEEDSSDVDTYGNGNGNGNSNKYKYSNIKKENGKELEIKVKPKSIRSDVSNEEDAEDTKTLTNVSNSSKVNSIKPVNKSPKKRTKN